jgi:hypothetical protein
MVGEGIIEIGGEKFKKSKEDILFSAQKKNEFFRI